MYIKPGDKVTVRSNLMVGTEYDGVIFTEQMKKTCGNQVVVKEKYYNLLYEFYLVEYNGELMEFTSEMFEQ